MDIPFDHFGIRQAGFATASEPVGSGTRLDWPGLSARLGAAHAARQILTVQPNPSAAASGSFAPAVARAVAAWRAAPATPDRSPGWPSSPGVNRDAKAVSKPTGTIGRNCAGTTGRLLEGEYD